MYPLRPFVACQMLFTNIVESFTGDEFSCHTVKTKFRMKFFVGTGPAASDVLLSQKPKLPSISRLSLVLADLEWDITREAPQPEFKAYR